MPTLNIKFKHLRNPENNKLYATICNLIDESEVKIAAGLSLCSTKDNFSRKIGRTISYNRALKALKSKKSSCPINRDNTNCEVIKIMKKYSEFSAFKSIYLLY